MANIIRTVSQLLAAFFDNTSRKITPQNCRDFVESAFGRVDNRDPTILDDRTNTSGAGFFDARSRWLNAAAPRVWECIAGDTGLADWRQVYPQGNLGTVTSVALAVPAQLSVSGSPVTTFGTITVSWVPELANLVLAGPTLGGPGLPAFRGLVVDDIPALPYVAAVSIDLTMPAEFVVSGSPANESGAFVVDWDVETRHHFLCGPVSGPPGVPTFRGIDPTDVPDLAYLPSQVITLTQGVTFNCALFKSTTTTFLDVRHFDQSPHSFYAGPGAAGPGDQPTFRPLNLADMPAGLGTGTVTSAGLTMPAQFAVGGSPITTAGTFAVTWLNETANLVLAGPAGGGPGIPTFRALVLADLPAGLATVTSVALTAPGEITVAGSPITTAGTFALTWHTQAKNTFFSGPATGADATPTFRAQTLADMPAGVAVKSLIALAGTTGAAYAPVFSLSEPVYGIDGCFNMKNTSGINQATYRITVTDSLGNTQVISAGFFAGTTQTVDFAAGSILGTGSTPPYTSFLYEIKDTIAGSHATYVGNLLTRD